MKRIAVFIGLLAFVLVGCATNVKDLMEDKDAYDSTLAAAPPSPPIPVGLRSDGNRGITVEGSVTIGTENAFIVDTDGDTYPNVIFGELAVDLAASDTYTITAVMGTYSFDIDSLDSDCTVTLPEASLWIGKTLSVCLSSANATHDLLLDPGDATDRFVDWDRGTNLTSAAGEYIAADGQDECVHMMSVGADTIVIIDVDGSLPSGWAEE